MLGEQSGLFRVPLPLQCLVLSTASDSVLKSAREVADQGMFFRDGKCVSLLSFKAEQLLDSGLCGLSSAHTACSFSDVCMPFFPTATQALP